MTSKPAEHESNTSPYTIVRRLTTETTGMGDVYLAKVHARYLRRRAYVNLPNLVVLKASKADIKLQDRLRKEAHLLQRCHHPNIVKIFPDPRSNPKNIFYTAAYSISGALRYQYAMEYVGKQSAGQRLEQQGRLGVQETVRIGVDIAKALEHIHAQAILNLDIKPSNIVLRQATFWQCLRGRTTEAVLCDFGTARLLSDRAHSYGTDGFASPEQYQENAGQISRIDQRSDLFSLGATLYTLLNGEPPCPQSALYVVSTIEPLSERNPKVSTKLANVIAKALAVDPNQRYQNATELRHALERHVSFFQIQKCQIMTLLLSLALLLILIGGTQAATRMSKPTFAASIASLFAPRTPVSAPHPTPRVEPVTPPATPMPTFTAMQTRVLTTVNNPVGAATATRVATRAPNPTVTETATPSPTAISATPVATVPPTAPIVNANITVLDPKPGTFIDGPAVVRWHYEGKLAANQAFEIRIWHDLDSMHYGAADATETTPERTQSGNNDYQYVLTFQSARAVQAHGGTEYNLAIAVVQLNPYQAIGTESEPIRIQVAN